MPPRFIHLHSHSHYSLLDGLAKIDDLVARAKELNMDAVALTDHGNLYGAIEFYKKTKASGIKPILGVEAYIAPGDHRDKTAQGDDRYYHLILLAENETGWRNLIKLCTKASLDGFYYKPRMDKAMLREHHEGLIALSGCLTGEISRLITANRFTDAVATAREYQSIFGANNFFIEIGHHPGIVETVKVGHELRRLARETGMPLVATQDFHYLKKEDAEFHDILLAVQTGDAVNAADRLTLKGDDFSMRSAEEMASFFTDVPEAITNTAAIADRCNVTIKLGEIQLPKFPVPDNGDANAYLRTLIIERRPHRYAELTPALNERIEYELAVVGKMGFADYFLIVQDFINWAKERGIVVGPGRGSAAGSIVSYILGITDVDPIAYDLLFERFLNPDRIQMPDIDIDITDRRRDEVFGYLQEKYGLDHVAHIITFGTMAARAAVRDVGRALGVPYSFCDKISKLIPFNQNLEEALENVADLKKLYDEDATAKKIIDAAKHLEGVARHASVHACGTVISKQPLTNYLPLQRAPQDEHVIVTQFEMHSVEDLGLLKMDLLGLKNLTTIEDAVRLINELHPETPFDIARIPMNDSATFALLQDGNTTGVFQLESSGMRRYLKELKPTGVEDIVAMVALYRPGPIELIPTYIRRKHGQEPVEYLHPKLAPILGTTYGVGVYQEQMMRIARDLAGYSLAEADTLRKAIGKKIRKLLDEQQAKLVGGMVKNGIPQKTAEAIWELFPPFARYGFNRCLAGNTTVFDPVTGKRRTIKEMHEQQTQSATILSMSRDMKFSPRSTTRVLYNGRKAVWTITTRSGRTITATSNHPFFTVSGWKTLEHLTPGTHIATPRRLPEPQQKKCVAPYRIALLGYLLAEGNFCHPHGFYFYSSQQSEIDDYISSLKQFANTTPTINNSKSAIAVYSRRTDILRPSAAVTWINALGLRYKKATEKFFPSFVFSLGNNDLALLIAKMFQGDGCINLKRHDPQIFYATSSPHIARDMQHLLLHLNVLSTRHTKKFRYRGGIKIGYTITINRYDNIQKFLNSILPHLVGAKKIVANKILATHPIINGTLKTSAARGSYDIIPVPLISLALRSALRERAYTAAGFAQSFHVAERLFYDDKNKKGYLRETIETMASALQNPSLHAHAESDIYWDEIKSIAYAGVDDTYDLTVDETHNFVADDIVVHNSHAVCYAMTSYQTAYLKAHYPVEFMTALLNCDAGDIDRLAELIAESNKSGTTILPPDINKSAMYFAPEGQSIRFGLAAIKNVGEAIVGAVIAERDRKGPFTDFADLLLRVQHKDLNKKSIESLAKCGALDSLGLERNVILENIEVIVSFASALRKQLTGNQTGLFATTPSNRSLKLKAVPSAPIASKLAWEKELLGLYVSDHPLNPHREKIKLVKARTIASTLQEKSEMVRLITAGMVTKVQKIVTKTGKPMLFAKLQDFDSSIEVVVFPETFSKTMALWNENTAVLLTGRMSWRDGEGKLICDNGQAL